MSEENEKIWLIRTRNKQILGPVSKKKILEFVERNSLQPNDEISRGNGYWFLIKEQDLLDKYVFGDVPQEFNPITEAPSVVVTQDKPGNTSSFNPSKPNLGRRKADTNEKIPESGELDYPKVDDGSTQLPEDEPADNTQMIQIPVKEKSQKVQPVAFDDSPSNNSDGKVPEGDDLDYPDIGGDTSEGKDDADLESAEKKKLAPNVSIVEESVVPPSERTANANINRIEIPQAKKLDNVVDDYDEDSDVNPIHRSRNDRYLYILLVLVLTILFAVIYYYKKILHKPLPLIGSIVSSAQAQTLRPADQKKKSTSGFEVLEIDGLLFDPIIDVHGFRLKATSSSAPESCNDLDKFGVKLHLIIQHQNLSKDWKNFKDKCSFRISGELGALIEYNDLKKKNLEIKDYLKPYKIKKKKVNKIKRMEKLSSHEFSEKSFSGIFIKIMNEDFKLKAHERLDLLNSYLEKVKKSENVYAVLTRLMIALEWGNISWAKREIKNLIHLDPIRYIYSIQRIRVPKSAPEKSEEIQPLIDSLKKIVNKAYAEKLLQKEVRIMVANFSLFIDGKEIRTLVDKTEANWSLLELRSLSVEGRRGREYFEFWYSALRGRTTSNEIRNYFKRSLNTNVIREMSDHALWVFSEYLPNDLEERKEIIKRAVELGNRSDPYENLTALRLITYEPLKKEIVKKVGWMKGARFNVKRKLFRKSLETGRAISFNIYNLLLLGDKDEELLWWLVLQS
ncbi:MAG: hypothetical protein KC493_00305 [Bacteriovoracaceae bacterium]|nr:hypothetical protein [Bacteriovoracaceae bacterium]